MNLTLSDMIQMQHIKQKQCNKKKTILLCLSNSISLSSSLYLSLSLSFAITKPIFLVLNVQLSNKFK